MIGAAAARARGVTPLAIAAATTLGLQQGPGGLLFRFHAVITKITHVFGPRVAHAWTQALLRYQRQINGPALQRAIASGRVRDIEAVVALPDLQAALAQAVHLELLGTLRAAGTASVAALRRLGVAARFNAIHPDVLRWALDHAGELVTSVPEDVRGTVNLVIALGKTGDLSVREQVKALRQVLGLPRNWALAPLRLGDELRTGQIAAATSRRLSAPMQQQIRSRAAADTITPDFVDQVTDAYAASLINLRAETISRTESAAAANAGAQEAWSQAVEDGTLDPDSRRFWIVTPDERLCPICIEIPGMNPDGVGIDEPFETPEGPVDNPPDPHPNCRCGVGLVLAGATALPTEAAPPPEEVPPPEEAPPPEEEPPPEEAAA